MRQQSILAFTLLLATSLTAACGDDDTSENHKPVAEAGSAASVIVGADLALDGSKSTDEDEDELTYKWTVKSKPEGSAATLTKDTDAKPVFKADAAGAYQVELVVNDGELASDADQVTITVTAVAP